MNLFSFFSQPNLLHQALTHRSYLNEHPQEKISNERLEFLGDAVIQLAVTEHLWRTFPQKSEGELTVFRSALVRTATLAQVATHLNLGELMRLSRGEAVSGGRTNPLLLANTFEAVVGALYLDQGLTQVNHFLSLHLLSLLPPIIARKLYQDAKSQLQEVVQAQGYPAPTYHLLAVAGPEHRHRFTLEVRGAGKVLGRGSGPTKQAAKSQAAQAALEKLTQTK